MIPSLRKNGNSDFPDSADDIVEHGEKFARWFIKDNANLILKNPLFFEPLLKGLSAAVALELDEKYNYFCPLKRELYENGAEAEFFSIWNKMLELKEYGLVLEKK
jgi:hypothetical protein